MWAQLKRLFSFSTVRIHAVQSQFATYYVCWWCLFHVTPLFNIDFNIYYVTSRELVNIKPRLHCYSFQSRRRYRNTTGLLYNAGLFQGITVAVSAFMNRNSIVHVRPPGETVANRHELCPLWRYGDCRLGHGVSRRRAGVAPTLAGQTTVWHGSSRWMPVKLWWTTVR